MYFGFGQGYEMSVPIKSFYFPNTSSSDLLHLTYIDPHVWYWIGCVEVGPDVIGR